MSKGNRMSEQPLEQKREFQGVWIPREIWLDSKLTWIEKLFLTEINSFCAGEKGCYANNHYFSKFFKLSRTRCGNVINALKKKGYILTSYSMNCNRSILMVNKIEIRRGSRK